MTTLNLQLSASAHDGTQHSGTHNAGRNVTISGLAPIDEATFSPGSHGATFDEWTGACFFSGVTIPQGATINSANFILTPQATWNAGSNVIKYYVSAQAADSAAILAYGSGTLTAANRPRTTATAVWTQTSIVVDVEQSVSITAVIQEIVNRAGWASGNAILIIIDVHEDCTEGEWQDYQSYDGSSSKAAKLQIVYTAGSPGPVARQTIIRQAVQRAATR